MREFDEQREARSDPKPARPSPGPSEAAELASAVGNQGMQRIARSQAAQRLPVGPESVAPATRVLARQGSEEEEEEEALAPAAEASGEQAGSETGTFEPDEERD